MSTGLNTIPTPTSPVKLRMVTEENNNKYYDMHPDGVEFIAYWGREGVTKTETRYPIGKWASTYKSKIKKGYTDVTHLYAETKVVKQQKEIDDPKVKGVFDKLLGFSNSSLKENYTISSAAVTPAQVSEAQGIIDELAPLVTLGSDKDRVNKVLLNLYKVIPRKMANVRAHLVASPIDTVVVLDSLRHIVDTEQKTLDVMAGQVKLLGMEKGMEDAPESTILDALGLRVEYGNAADIDRVKALMGNDARELRDVFKVEHVTSRAIYTDYIGKATNPKQELFWHGSRNENWISILQTGLKIRPTNAIHNGSMFGDGIYFADKYRKSANYTSMRGSYWAKGNAPVGFLALLDVHVGKQLPIKKHNSECYKFSESVLRQKGNYDSVFAQGGADLINNEYIVYNNAQTTITYLIQVGN